MPVEGRGLSSGPTQDVVRDLEIGQPGNSEKCSETADGVTRESEGGGRLSLLRSVRQDQPRRHSGYAYAQCRSNKSLPLRRQGARRVSTARILRRSRRMGSSGGWRNWRLRSGRRLTSQSQSDECIYRTATDMFDLQPPRHTSTLPLLLGAAVCCAATRQPRIGMCATCSGCWGLP